MSERDCKHGHLARSCEICQLEADNAALRARVAELEGELREYREQLKSPLFHIIEFRDDGWTIQHPLSCPPDLFNCLVNRAAERDLYGPPEEGPGRYVCGVDSEGTFWYEDTPVDVLEALAQGGQDAES